jgi:DNA-binding beta-propeller fold protein YncE
VTIGKVESRWVECRDPPAVAVVLRHRGARSGNLLAMANRVVVFALALAIGGAAEIGNAPQLPHKLVKDWAKLPAGWNFGECSGVAVDKDDNVWVFNRGKHPVVQFDRNGKMLRSWDEVPVVSSHGIRVDNEGFVWLIDVAGHQVFKMTPEGKLVFRLGAVGGQPGANNDEKESFNRPTGITFAPNGDFFLSDGYVNSRVVKYNKSAEYITHWGTKGKGDGQFDLVHDVALDSRGRVYVADRTNQRVQIFDSNGKFLNKWTGIGAPWGLYYVDKEKAIYMCDGLNDRLVKLNLEGQVLGVLGSHGKEQGKFDFVHNLGVDSAGSIYTVEIKNWRVQKFAAR